MPREIPHVDELGVTSGPLKSAAFFLGASCKDYNGAFQYDGRLTRTDDFMLCRNENADPEHCLKEGRRVTRCAQALCVRRRSSVDGAASRSSVKIAAINGRRITNA